MRELIQNEKSNDVLLIRTIISQKSQFAQGWGDNALILVQIAMILNSYCAMEKSWLNRLNWSLSMKNTFLQMISYDFLLNQLKCL